MTVAICNCCSKDVSVANMGEAALTSHMKDKKHVERSPSDQCIESLMPPTPSPIPAPEPGNVLESSNDAGQQKPIDKMLVHASTLEAEIQWVLTGIEITIDGR